MTSLLMWPLLAGSMSYILRGDGTAFIGAFVLELIVICIITLIDKLSGSSVPASLSNRSTRRCIRRQWHCGTLFVLTFTNLL